MARTPKQGKRGYIKLDDHIWSHDGVRSLSDSAALAYVYMIAWSSANRLDGVVNKTGAKFSDAGPDELDELLKAGFIEPFEDVWKISKFSEWQLTNDEHAISSEKGATNGSKGGYAKKANQIANALANSGPTTEETPGDVRDSWMIEALSEWPPPGTGYFREEPANIRPVFRDAVANEVDWEQFQIALRHRIWRYKQESAGSRVDRRRSLSSFMNFCQHWRDELILKAAEDLAISKPAEPEPNRAVAPVVVQDEV